jgi:hypothetical protein
LKQELAEEADLTVSHLGSTVKSLNGESRRGVDTPG